MSAIIDNIPTRKNERYKYADFSFITENKYALAVEQDFDSLKNLVDKARLKHVNSKFIVVVNGFFVQALSDTAFEAGVTISPLSTVEGGLAANVKAILAKPIDANKYPLAVCCDPATTVLIHVSEQQHIHAPLHILNINSAVHACYAQARNVICLETGSQLEIFNEYISDGHAPYVENTVNLIHVGNNARLELTKCQHESVRAHHIAHTFVQQLSDSQFNYVNFSSGANFYRDDVVVDLAESGAECKTSGFYKLLNDNQYADNHIDVNHLAPRTSSVMHYKGYLDNKSKAVFNGRLFVKEDAQKIVAHQENHNILLSKYAEVYSKPELEIYADDVKCKHGATTGQIDQDALFYLRARGIPQKQARAILLAGFAEELLENISKPCIRQHIKETVIANES